MIVMAMFPLNIRSREVRADLIDSQRLHMRIMGMFAGVARDQNRVLYRVDGAANEPALLVQSEVLPNMQVFPQGYLRGAGRIRDDLQEPFAQITNGQRLRFRLRVNVTKKLATQQQNNGKRIAITDAVAQMEWLVRKGQQSGFALIPDPFAVDGYAVTVIDEGRDKGLRRQGDTVNTLTHYAIRFEGLLEVTDSSKFYDALVHGIGSAKAYGCGLLSVALP